MSLENATPMEKFRNSCGFQFNFVFHSGLSVEEAIDHLCERAGDYWRRAMAEEGGGENARFERRRADHGVSDGRPAEPFNAAVLLAFDGGL